MHVLATRLVIHSQDNTLLADPNVFAACHMVVLSYIEADHAIADMNKLSMFPYNLTLSAPRYIRPMIVSS